MRTRNIVLVILMTSFFMTSYGQSYHHAIGGQIAVGFFKHENSAFLDESNPYVPGAVYKATLLLSDNFGVSAYPFVGLSGSANSRSGASGSIGIELPVVAEMYLGDIEDNCFFFGAGISYGFLGDSYSGSGSVFGPQVGLGGQFEIQGQLIGARASFTYGLNKSDKVGGLEWTTDSNNLVSLAAFYVLGQ